MFLLFHLQRPDVLSGGDLGIRKAIQIEYRLEEMPTPTRVIEIGEPWRPHRSLASLYLWESLAAVRVVRARASGSGSLAVTLVAVGSVTAALLVYHDDDRDFQQMQRDEATRAAHQMEAVAGLSVGQLNSAAAFFRAEDDLSRHEFAVYGRLVDQPGGTVRDGLHPTGDGGEPGALRTQSRPVDPRTNRLPRLPAGSGPRAEYFPITYVAAEREERRRALGYDLSQDPNRAPYLERAQRRRRRRDQSGDPTADRRPRDQRLPRRLPRRSSRSRPSPSAAPPWSASPPAASGSRTSPAPHRRSRRPTVQVQLRRRRRDHGRTHGRARRRRQRSRSGSPTAAGCWSSSDPGRPDVSLPLRWRSSGIALAALLGSLILVWSRNERMQELQREASQDPLTGLKNRRRFEEDLRRRWRGAGATAPPGRC